MTGFDNPLSILRAPSASCSLLLTERSGSLVVAIPFDSILFFSASDDGPCLGSCGVLSRVPHRKKSRAPYLPSLAGLAGLDARC